MVGVGVQITGRLIDNSFTVISLPLFHILIKVLQFLPCCRTNRTVTCWSHIILTVLSHFSQLHSLLLSPTCLPETAFPWSFLFGYLTLSGFTLSLSQGFTARPPRHLVNVLCPSLVPLEERDGTSGSRSLFGTYSQAWMEKQCFSLNRENADRCAVFTSGYLEIQLHLASPLFLYLLGEGIRAFIVLVFFSSWGGCLGHILRDARPTLGVGQLLS